MEDTETSLAKHIFLHKFTTNYLNLDENPVASAHKPTKLTT